MRRALLLLVPLGAASLAFTWVVEPNLIIGLRSPRALAWAAGLGAGCAVVGLLTHRLTHRLGLALALGALPGVVATGLIVVRPILNPRELVEALPSVAPAGATPAPTATAAAPTPTTGALPSATAPAPAATGPAPAPPTATGKPAPAPTSATGAPTAAPTAGPTAATGAPTAAPTAAAEPQRVSSGELRGLAGHDARGTVSTYRLTDGSYLVRFEDVEIGGTPSPHVYVIEGHDQRKKGGVHLGPLKAERGSFNYPLPDGFVTSGYTVLVWCEQFAVEIANATQV